MKHSPSIFVCKEASLTSGCDLTPKESVMDIQSQLRALSDKILTLKDQITTEEATKTAFVMPFINLLGYDIFNPMEVVPEFTADIGLKKGEKVDFAIFQEKEPILIIECKHWKENLGLHDSQLFRYFHVTKTRFALLTNGIEYKFYTDLEEKNKMDLKPFLEFDITRLKEGTILEIQRFQKQNFDVENILNTASALKYTKELKKAFSEEIENPSADLVKLLINKVYSGRITQGVLTQFTEFTSKAINQFINEKINDRIQAALNSEKEVAKEHEIVEEVEESKIETTEEELEAFKIVRAICRRAALVDRIQYRDTQSYFGILLDDNNRKPICRLHLNASTKYIGILDENKNETRHKIESIDDIYTFESSILATLKTYL